MSSLALDPQARSNDIQQVVGGTVAFGGLGGMTGGGLAIFGSGVSFLLAPIMAVQYAANFLLERLIVKLGTAINLDKHKITLLLVGKDVLIGAAAVTACVALGILAWPALTLVIVSALMFVAHDLHHAWKQYKEHRASYYRTAIYPTGF